MFTPAQNPRGLASMTFIFAWFLAAGTSRQGLQM
jgi:hypothetical protein